MTTSAKTTNWQKVRLGSLGEFRNGVNFGKDKKGEGIRLVNVKDIFSSGIALDFDSMDKVDLADQRGIENYFVREGDLFFVRSSVKREGVGLVSMARRNDDETVHCGFVIRFRPTSRDVDPLFLTYMLRSPYYREVVRGLSSGVAITNISQDGLGSLSVQLPPLPTQHRIASILSAYDDLIENNTRRIKILEQMAQAIYREWFVEFRAPGVKLRKASIDEKKVTGKDQFPVGWELKQIGNVADVNATSIGKDNVPESINYVDIASVSTGSIDNVQEMTFNEAPGRARRVVKHGDIIWSSVRPNRKSYSLILNPLPNLIVSTGFAVISASQVPYTYLYETTTTDAFVSYLVNHAKGAAYPAVSSEDFRDALILIPNNDLLDQFHEMTVNNFELAQNLKTKNANLRRTRDLLLPRLISGEVEVSG